MAVTLMAGCTSAVTPSLKVPAPSDPTVAFQAACDGGDAKSCSDLGNHLSVWKVVPHDEPRAARAFMKGCNLGRGEACASAALMFEAGRGVALDLGEALALHGRACTLGNEWSCADQRRLSENAELPGELTRDPHCAAPCVADGLEREAIARVMRRREGSVRHCYQLALSDNQKLVADVSTKFVIGAEGGVEQVEIPSTTDSALATCVGAALRTFRFPRPIGGGRVNVNYPYAFRTPESVDAGTR